MALLPNVYNNVFSDIGRIRINYTGHTFEVGAPATASSNVGEYTTFNAYITLDPTNVANPINNNTGTGYTFPSSTLPDSYGGTANTPTIIASSTITAGSWAYLDNTIVQDFDINTTKVKAAFVMGTSEYISSATIVNYKFHTPNGSVIARQANISWRGDGAGAGNYPTYFVDDVTSIVEVLSNVGSGEYAVSDVSNKPMNGSNTIDQYNYYGSGWFLVVVLEDQAFPIQTVDVYAGRGYSDIAVKKNWGRTLQEATASFLLTGGWVMTSSDSYRYMYLANGWRAVDGPNNVAPYFFNRRRYDRAGNLMTQGSFSNYNTFPTPPVALTYPTPGGAAISNVDVTALMNLNVNATNFGMYFYNGYILTSPGAVLEQRGAISNPTISKTVSPTTVNREQPVTFTIVFKSLGAPSTNLELLDSLDSRFKFMDNSIYVNGVNRVGYDLSTVTLPDLTANQSVTITFKAMADNVIGGYTVPNTAYMKYDYAPISGTVFVDTISATCVTTIVDVPLPRLSKAVNLNYAYVGETITYTINVYNQGTTGMINTKVFDTIPNNTTFVPGSVTIDGVSNPTANPAVGINSSTIAGGQTKVIKFKVYANTIPSPNPMPNTTYTVYDYTVLGIGSFQANTLANTVTTQINDARILTVNKTVDKASADVGQTITYGINFKNIGNAQAENLIFVDTFPNNISFIPNTVKINGATSGGDDPQIGISLSNLLPNASYTLEYKVFVNEIPNEDPIINIATLSYDFTVDPVLATKLTRNLISNNANTKINNATFKQGGIVKTVDKLFADLDQVLTYTVTLTNKGNVTATNVILIDQLDSNLEFKSNSVIIDGLPTGGVNPLLGIPIDDIAAHQTVEVSFKATVVSIPDSNSIPNIASVYYKYTVNTLDDTSGQDSSPKIFSVISRAIISNEDGGLVKSSLSNYADVGDVVTYSIVMDNTGNSIATSMFLIDTIPNGMTFIPGTFKINGIAFPTYDPNIGCDIGVLGTTGGKSVTFDAVVDTIPANPINNKAYLSYKYTVDPATPNGASQTNVTNVYPITVNHGLINMMAKGSDVEFAKKGNIINYTVTIPNAGNVELVDVVVKDTIPLGTSVVQNSLLVDGLAIPGDISSGVNIGNIAIGGVRTISFAIKIDTIPNNRLVENEATANFKYTVDPSLPNGKTGQAKSNLSVVNINQAVIDPLKGDLFKSVNKKYALVNDIVKYSIFLRNSGNVTADTVEIRDILSLDTTFQTGTVKINNISKPSENPNTGINVGALPVNAVATVTFDVKVNTIPSTGSINNEATVEYTYELDPINGVLSRDTEDTNTTTVYINQAGVIASDNSFKIDVDKAFAEIGDTLEYTITLNNYGNVDIYDAIVLSTIPQGTTLVPNSVKINNIIVNENPMSSIRVGTIPTGTTSYVKFKVLVNSLPAINPLINSASIDYVFTLNPSNPLSEFRSENTSIVKTTLNQAIVSIVKAVDKGYVKLGDTAKYSFVLKNTGNVDANSITIYDTIPDGTVFVGNSVKVNGVIKTGVSPNTGIIVPKVVPGGTSNIEFQIKVMEFPNGNSTIPNSALLEYNYIVDPSNPNGVIKESLSNDVNIIIRDPNIKSTNNSFTKYVNKTFAVVDETILYTLVINNIGNTRATNLLITDTIPMYTSFVENSVSINGVSSIGTNPGQGISIATLEAKESLTISFEVLVNSIPPSDSVPNTAKLNYNFTVNQNNVDGETVSLLSNTVLTNIKEANISVEKGGLSKKVNRSFADLGEEISYTISMTNLGNVVAEDVTLYDTIPQGATLIQSSVKVNGSLSNVSPANGILVGNLLPNENALVEFSVVVDTLPLTNPISNTGMVSFNYRSTETSTIPVSRTSKTETVSTKINSAIVTLTLEGDKTKVIIGDQIKYTAKIKNEGNINANDLIFYGSIPVGTVLIPNNVRFKIIESGGETLDELIQNSIQAFGVTVDGNLANGEPLSGVIIGQLPPGAQVIVVYDVLVVSIPSSQNFIGGGNVQFSYNTNPGIPVSESGSASATVPTIITINDPDITVDNGSLTKYVDKAFAKVTDIVKYDIVLYNNGNVMAENVIINDTLPEGTLLVQDSIKINDVAQSGVTNLSPLNLGNINMGDTITVSFQVVVVYIPTQNPVLNSAYVTYDFNNGSNSRDINTNVVQTEINFADISTITNGILKSVDKSYAKIGETVNYTIQISNNGNVAANNVLIIDTLPQGIEFIQNSITVNAAAKPGVVPEGGIWLGVVDPNENILIKFKGIVTKIPTINPALNEAIVNYNYTIDPNIINGEFVSNKSNKVSTKINDVNFTPDDGSFIKAVNNSVTDINTEIKYTIVAKNKGNVNALGAIITDVISNDTEFIDGSLKLNGIAMTNSDINIGLNVGNIAVGKTVTIEFSVIAHSIPDSNPVLNEASIEYIFVKDPVNSPNGEVVVNKTNETEVLIKTAGPLFNGPGGFNKEFSKEYARLSDCVVCKFQIPNNGNVKMTNILLTDVLSECLEFEAGSVYIDGINDLIASPESGILIDEIMPGDTKEVLFKTTVIKIPEVNPIENKANLTYSYSIDDALRTTLQGSIESNSDYLNVLEVVIKPNFEKTVDKAFAEPGDILTYKIKVLNTGNTTANNVSITDILPEEVMLISDSIEINCVETENLDLESGIVFNQLEPDMLKIICFKVLIVSIPKDGFIDNTACIKYDFIVNPNEAPIDENFRTDTVKTSVKSGELTCVKESNVNYGTLGDEVSYKITVTNIGNTDSTMVVVKDSIPQGLILKPGTLKKDGTLISGNILNGVNVGTVSVNSASVIEFIAIVTAVPKVNPLINKAIINYEVVMDNNSSPIKKMAESNLVPLTVQNGVITVVKNANISKAIIGDTIVYGVLLKNIGNVTVSNVNVTDMLPQELSFVQDSLKVNNSEQIGVNLKDGIIISSINPNEVTTISYLATINGTNDDGLVSNTAKASYSFIVGDQVGRATVTTVYGETISNAVVINVDEISQLIEKKANREEVPVGGTIGYTITVENTGTLKMLNTTLMDSIPDGTSLISSSFKVNGVSKLWPIVGDIDIGEVVTIYYEIKVNKYVENIIENKAFLKFNYRLNPTDSLKIGYSREVSSFVTLISPNFTQISFDGSFELPCDKDDILSVTEVNAEVEIISSDLINTPMGTSESNFILTGNKLVVTAMARLAIEYISNNGTKAVKTVTHERLFTRYIVLPESYVEGSGVDVSSLIEDLYAVEVSNREIFFNLTVFLYAGL